ncbi:methyltransferase domain-containing protein [Emticicia sp. BO119]|uniref:methyltransferase domain-containing protein n=1 Tax=Emticicia sp. BO119 TaxID=2757768 RepID=UPI0015F0BA6A|nr:methyltransferase domain-containing protein [Emticicia sp. BO119]MBA4852989.1 methyltransferase domain-containing protein [Emticicia sp. BO119]
MAWNPDIYNKFKSERFAPFYDCLNLVAIRPGIDVIDLGCGTGELTRKLADALPGSKVLGIDSSQEMLNDSKAFANEQVQFKLRGIEEQINLDEKWDLVFSNAAIQWVYNHEELMPEIISMIKPGGQLVIQLPNQNQNLSNLILDDLATQEPFCTALQNWTRNSPVLDIERYAQILFENGSKQMSVFEKIYPLVLKDGDALFDWVSGTALIPYTERLSGDTKEQFNTAYKERLKSRFPKSPAFYPFKRIIMEAKF